MVVIAVVAIVMLFAITGFVACLACEETYNEEIVQWN